ncbi:MAG: hypothetical protein PWP21_1371 [Thermosediminibacterales bacterium]|nr:hypothetical protein [Thermosediminibacterales bacterium]
MIEYCNNIEQCEKALRTQISEISILGNIPLTQKDVDILGSFLKNQIKATGVNNSYLKEIPISVSLFLVWKGILEYQEGNYWSIIYESLGLPKDETKWQKILGDVFLLTLRQYNLPTFQTEGHKYVTPILVHGIIPNKYMENFFENFLWELFGKSVISELDKNEVIHKIKTWRDDHAGHKKLQRELDSLNDKLIQVKKEFNFYQEIFENWKLLNELNKLYKQQRIFDELEYLLSLPEDYLDNRKEQIKELETKLNVLNSRLNNFNSNIKIYNELQTKTKKQKNIFMQFDKKEKELKKRIKQISTNILKREWSNRYGDSLKNLPFEKLKEYIKEYKKISENQKNKGNILEKIKLFILSIFGFKTRYSQELLQKIHKILKEIPVKESILNKPDENLYNELKDLKTVYEDYCINSARLNNFKKDITEQVKTISQIAATNEINADNLFERIPLLLEERIERANKEIHHLQIKINKLHKKIEETNQDISNYKMKLTVLGRGNLQDGILILKDQRKIREKIDLITKSIKTKNDINCLLEKMEQMIDKEKQNVEKKVKRFKNQIAWLKVFMAKKQELIASYPEPLYFLNESTKKFILYGGKTADEFVYNCLLLLRHLIKEVELEEIDTQINIPPRIKKAIKKWFTKNRKRLLKNHDKNNKTCSKEFDTYIREPKVIFDSIKTNIKIIIPEERISLSNIEQKGDVCVCFKVYEGKKEKLILKQDLKLYRTETTGIFKTEQKEVILPHPTTDYVLLLEYKDKTLRKWKIKGVNDKTPFMLFNKNKELVENDSLPNDDEIWIIIRDNYTIEPDHIIKANERLTGKWNDYTFVCIDASKTELVYIKKQNEITNILTKNIKIKPGLIGGKKLSYCNVEDSMAYVEDPPDIIFHIENKNRLRLWRISIKHKQTNQLSSTKYYNLDELRDKILIKDKIVKVPLKTLLKNKYGFYTISIQRRRIISLVEKFSFAFIPDLKIKFDKNIYVPCVKKFPEAYLKITSSCSFNFQPNPPAQKIKQDKNSCEIKTKISKSEISGNLAYDLTDKRIILPLNIKIPSISWKIETSGEKEKFSWSSIVKKIWHEDIFDSSSAVLKIKIPEGFADIATLTLNDNDQKSSSKVKGNQVVYDLKKFGDTLRESNTPLQKFYLSFPNRDEIDALPILYIRTKWEVKDIEVHQELQDEKRKIEIRWEEKGKARNRILRLWNLRKSENNDYEPMKLKIKEGQNSLMIIKERVDMLPLGCYRIQFDTENLWGSTYSRLPQKNQLNTKDVFIGTKTEVIDAIKTSGIKLTKLEDEKGKQYNLDPEYPFFIQEIEEAPEFKNEERFKGNLYFLGPDGRKISMKTNPVSFYINYDKEYLPFLIDEEGDGVVYCPKCKQIFWEWNEYRERHKKIHIEPVKIFYSL